MIKVFYGEDRIKAKAAIEKFLGPGYEIIDCTDLTSEDLPSIFSGGTLFADERAILLRDFTANKSIYEKLPDFLNTKHKIALFELKLDKRSATYKELKDKIEFKEFPTTENRNFSQTFDIFKVAKKDGKKAVTMLREIEQTEDPIMFFGLLVSQALKDFNSHPGTKEKRVLLELSHTDLQMKSVTIQPWLLIESFLLRVSSL